MEPVFATSEIGRGVNRAQYDQSILDLPVRCSGLAAFSSSGSRVVMPAFRHSIVCKELPVVHASTKTTALARGHPSPFAWMLMCDHWILARTSPDDDENIQCLTVSPDGKTLAVFYLKRVDFWDLRHMAVIDRLDVQHEHDPYVALMCKLHDEDLATITAVSSVDNAYGKIVFVAYGMLCKALDMHDGNQQTTWIAAGDESDHEGERSAHVSAICGLHANCVATCTTSGWVELITCSNETVVRRTWQAWQTQHLASTAEYKAPMAICTAYVAVGVPTGVWLLNLDSLEHKVHELPTLATTITGMVFNEHNLLVYVTRDGAVHVFNPNDESHNQLEKKILVYQNSAHAVASSQACCILCPIAAEHKHRPSKPAVEKSEKAESDDLKQLFSDFLEYRNEQRRQRERQQASLLATGSNPTIFADRPFGVADGPGDFSHSFDAPRPFELRGRTVDPTAASALTTDHYVGRTTDRTSGAQFTSVSHVLFD